MKVSHFNKNQWLVAMCLWLVTMCPFICVNAADVPLDLPKPAKKAPDMTKPIKVFVLAGQSNMLEMGTIDGRTSGAHQDFYQNAGPTANEKKKHVNIAVYKGAYSPGADYDKIKPEYTGDIEIGDPRRKRVKRRRIPIPMEPFPALSQKEGYTTVLRGYISVSRPGKYEFEPGNKDAAYNVTTVDGKEIYRKDVGQEKPKVAKVELEPGKRYAFKTIYFKKPNHHFRIPLTNVPGAMSTLADEDKRYAFLRDDKGEWMKRNDVFFLDVHPLVNKGRKGNFLQIPTKPGGKGIGVELMFGNVMGHVFDEPVLLIRSACGNRGLWSGFRSPSRGGWEKDDTGKYGWTGTEYRFLRDGVNDTLKNIANIFPGYKGQGYDIAGFVWFQGHKDTGNAETAKEYEENLVALIKDVRKDLNKPKLPVMIATVGFNGKDMSGNTLVVHQAQMAVGDPKKHPGFAGTVKTIDTRDFWRSQEVSPSGQGYHYNRNAETYMLIGDALGRGMLKLNNEKK